MKTFFNIIKPFFLLLAVISIIGSSCNEDNEVSSPTNKFTIDGVDYETPFCYIEFDEDNQNEINFFFLNGKMKDNTTYPDGNTNDYLFSKNTTNWVFYNIRDLENPSIVSSYPNIQQGNTYVGSSNDSALGYNLNIISFSSPLMINNEEFGYGDDTQGTFVIGGTPTITINSYNFDIQTQTGAIDVDYNFNGYSGHFSGAVGVFLD